VADRDLMGTNLFLPRFFQLSTSTKIGVVMNSEFILIVIIIALLFLIATLRFKYFKRFVEAQESISESLKKLVR